MCCTIDYYHDNTHRSFSFLCSELVLLHLHWQRTVKEILVVTQPFYVKGSIYWKLQLEDWLCELQPRWIHVGMLITAFDILIGEGVHATLKMGTCKNDRRWDDQRVCILCVIHVFNRNRSCSGGCWCCHKNRGPFKHRVFLEPLSGLIVSTSIKKALNSFSSCRPVRWIMVSNTSRFSQQLA